MNLELKQALQELKVAHQATEKFIAERLEPGKSIEPTDFFEMALAYDNDTRAWLKYQLVCSRVYPGKFGQKEISYFEKQIEELSRKIQSWEQRKFPSSL